MPVRPPPSSIRFPPSLREHKARAFEHGHAKPADFVFASETGGSLHYRNIVRRGLDKGIEKAGLPHLAWHDLRHVAASALIGQGASVVYLSRVLGHASPAITLNTYAHVFSQVEHADRMRDAMEAAFGEVLR